MARRPQPVTAEPTSAPSPMPTLSLDVSTNQNLVAIQQFELIAQQAVLMKQLQDFLAITPPGPAQPIPPVPAGTNLQALIDTQTAAIRLQSAYIAQLENIVALLSGTWATPHAVQTQH